MLHYVVWELPLFFNHKPSLASCCYLLPEQQEVYSSLAPESLRVISYMTRQHWFHVFVSTVTNRNLTSVFHWQKLVCLLSDCLLEILNCPRDAGRINGVAEQLLRLQSVNHLILPTFSTLELGSGGCGVTAPSVELYSQTAVFLSFFIIIIIIMNTIHSCLLRFLQIF